MWRVARTAAAVARGPCAAPRHALFADAKPPLAWLRSSPAGHPLTVSRAAAGLRAAGTSAEVRPLILVLDLDETLVRTKIQGVHKARKLVTEDFNVVINVNNGVPCSVSKRPGVGAFFDWIRERRKEGLIEGPWLFGQGKKEYVEAVLSKLDPDREIFGDRLLTKEYCIQLQTPWPWVVKDLATVPIDKTAGDAKPGAAHVQRMVLVDNFPVAATLCPGNTLMVRDWLGDDRPDREFARATALLDSVIEGARSGAGGRAPDDYAGRLVDAMPGHAELQRRLATLKQFLDDGYQPGRGSVKDVLQQVWAESCEMKQVYLGLKPGEY